MYFGFVFLLFSLFENCSCIVLIGAFSFVWTDFIESNNQMRVREREREANTKQPSYKYTEGKVISIRERKLWKCFHWKIPHFNFFPFLLSTTKRAKTSRAGNNKKKKTITIPKKQADNKYEKKNSKREGERESERVREREKSENERKYDRQRKSGCSFQT